MISSSSTNNIIYNDSLKDFIKQFLSSVQKQASLDKDMALTRADSHSKINKDKFQEIVKIILYLFWRLVSNNVVGRPRS